MLTRPRRIDARTNIASARRMKTTIRANKTTHLNTECAAERRGNTRIPTRIPVRIFGSGDSSTGYDVGICTDITETGMAFETEANLNLCEPVQIEFHLTNQPIYRRELVLFYRVGPRYGGYFQERKPFSTVFTSSDN